MTSGGSALQHAGQSFAVLLPRFDRRCWRARSDLFIVAALAGRGGVRKHVRGMNRNMLEHELEKPMARVRSVAVGERCVGENERETDGRPRGPLSCGEFSKYSDCAAPPLRCRFVSVLSCLHGPTHPATVDLTKASFFSGSISSTSLTAATLSRRLSGFICAARSEIADRVSSQTQSNRSRTVTAFH